MKTIHKIHQKNSQFMDEIHDESVDLVVTSPPYPMIEMWDGAFSRLNQQVELDLRSGIGANAFRKMHQELGKTWYEIHRVMKPGGIVCINIGDSTRSIGDFFQLFPSHAEIISEFRKLGFVSLPEIIWRKQTNAPNKFMGSGMLPPGAYVTLEHEFVLLFRKGGKREFESDEIKRLRQESSYFWEERNTWFSDIWDFKGTSQKINSDGSRERSAAFPLEMAYRLVNMFSIKHDTVLDPFLGTGTTSIAAIASRRNSIGYEIEPGLVELANEKILKSATMGNEIIITRIKNHLEFINSWIREKEPPKYINMTYKFPVITSQEAFLMFDFLESVEKTGVNEFRGSYNEGGSFEFGTDLEEFQMLLEKLRIKKRENKRLSEFLVSESQG